MQQRQLRLGDVLDDYCPRERRITNHAVVAMIGQEVKQTRCTTCDADHEYKHARVPPARRKKDAAATAYSEVLASVQQEAAGGLIRAAEPPEDRGGILREPAPAGAVTESAAVSPEGEPEPARTEPAASAGSLSAPDAALETEAAEPDRGQDEGPVHRRLIRATLPRSADTPAARPVPQFTMRDAGPRAGHFRSKGAHRTQPGGAGRSPHGRPGAANKHTGSRKGGFAPHARSPRHGHGAHASRPGKKRSR